MSALRAHRPDEPGPDARHPTESRFHEVPMTDIATEPPRAHARIVYLGPVSPHWEVYGDYGDRTLLDEFRARVLARLVLPRDDPQFRRNRRRIVRDAELERITHRVGPRPRRGRGLTSGSDWRISIRDAPLDRRAGRARAPWTGPRHVDGLLNRRLSWLDFNDRMLSLAAEASVPLLERVKFAAISSSNLDEFFEVRVAALQGSESRPG
ncbi:MAG: hypothetical protein H6514_20710 [Acidimicrobiaceae bacterium]|nr:hypothetical protein [Acidimicrobiaceae bacterium]